VSAESKIPHHGLWIAALVLTAMSTGIGFGISPKLGWSLAGLTLCVYLALFSYAFRFGRRRRREGHKPDIPALQQRLRKRLKWQALSVALLIITTSLTLAHNDHRVPTWVLVAPPLLIGSGAALIWVTVQYVLPRAERRQVARESETH
jgi:hypothetical protein